MRSPRYRGRRRSPKVRRILADINDKLRAAIMNPPDGPPLNRTPFDVERVVREWRALRPT